MNKNQLYEILSTKPHNKHYLDRYLKFVESRVSKVGDTYLEKHHICPKASDMFPNFSSLVEHKWNRIDLTLREHFIAHWILWKCFGGSQAYAFHKFRRNHKDRDCSGLKLNSRSYELSVKEYKSFLKSRKTNTQKGMAPAKHAITNEYLGNISITDSRWSSHEIVGVNKGTHTNFSRNNPSHTSIAAKTVGGELLGMVLRTDPRWVTGEIVGCHYGKSINPGKATAFITGTGLSLGKVSCDDPRWKTGEICSPNKYRKLQIKTME